MIHQADQVITECSCFPGNEIKVWFFEKLDEADRGGFGLGERLASREKGMYVRMA